jgi:hypothetical protein
MVHETGIQLITGDAGGVGATYPAHHDPWVAAALGLVVLGLAGSLLARGRAAALVLTMAALAAAVASLVGASQEVPSADVQAQLAAGPPGGDAAARRAAGALIRARLEYGYFVSLGGLIAAAAAGGLALVGRRSAGGDPR